MSTRRVVALEDFSKELGDFAQKSLAAKRKATILGIQRSIPDLVASSPVDTGLYAASWEMQKTDESVILGNTAPYAGVIEHGARPFTPPIAPLLAWAKRKLTGQKGITTGQPETDYSSEVWALAKGVQKAIAARGMIPHHIMENAIPGIKRNIIEELKKLA